ncbi:MAG: DUF3426 domain-containing protein [Gammaproteobacteria bacterium]|nr:MAG: DUF3426 domain-containing protein [Gammaproteobacteria bacterium]
MNGWMVACPECGTRFRVQEGQLVVADGIVRCGACLTVFQASERLELFDPNAPVAAPEQASTPRDRHRSVLAGRGEASEDDVDFEPLQGPVPTMPLAEVLAPTPPSLEADTTKAQHRLGWAVVLGFGLLLAAGQFVYWTFPDGALDPELRPYYAWFCERVGCALPERRDVAAIRSRRLSVTSHPDYAYALLLEAAIENAASYPQPFPIIEVRFETVRGEAVAVRRFAPEHYLAGEVAIGTQMPPNRSVRIAMAFESPGDDAVNYQLRFW